MELKLAGKVAVVTGGAKGIGAATARAFVREGARAAILDIDDSALALAAELGPSAKFIHCDVSLAASVKSAIESVCAAFGGIDILVNNAGIQTYGNVDETTEELWDRTL